MAAVKTQAETRRREEAEQRARERTAHLDEIASREAEIWQRVEALLEMKRAAEYDQAVTYLKNLRDVAKRSDTSPEFDARVRQLRARHPNKPAFLKRLKRARLGRE